MSDEIFAHQQLPKPAPTPFISLPLINLQLHPSGQWSAGLYKGYLISKAREALSKLSDTD
jgi:hypothetical protein